jgi:hypothetical protein
MKLYDVPRYSFIKVEGVDKILFFNKIDGMYSLCEDDKGVIYHIGASTEVENVSPPKNWKIRK